MGWSVSCWDSNFLVGEAQCAFDSLGAAAAGQFAGVPRRVLQTASVLAASWLRKTHENYSCNDIGRRHLLIDDPWGPHCKWMAACRPEG